MPWNVFIRRLSLKYTLLRDNWDNRLPWLLLAARKVVQEVTGYNPNNLVFGHKVLKDSWEIPESPQNLLDYVKGSGLDWFLQLNVKRRNW